MKEFWNRRYAQKEYVYGKNPNQYFEQVLSQLKPGKILLAAEGEGRNAVFAASLGWEVYAYDFSEEAYKKAMKLALEKEVQINYQIGSLSDLNFKANFFDAIGLIYVHFPEQLRKQNHRLLANLVAPKGSLILEAFSKNHSYCQLQNPSVGGPKMPSQLYSTAQLKEDFESFQMRTLKEEYIELSEGHFHVGRSSVVRMHSIKTS